MTQERITPNVSTRPGFYSHLEDHPPCTDQGPRIAPDPSPLKRDPANGSTHRSQRWQEERRRALEYVLKKLSASEAINKGHIEEYLRDQYRRHLSPSSFRNSLYSIVSFLSFVKRSGKSDLEEITRSDLEGWIEHEQDRGLKPLTVELRLRLIKAFFRYLIERDVIRPDVLSKRMRIKVPDPLPRAMDPDDVARLVSVIEPVRDRAMILVLLRTGMRVGELLNTLVEDVNFNERRIEIYEASKNRVGRVVYLSDDALGALKAWFKKRQAHKPYVFYSKSRPNIAYPAVRRIFMKYLERAELSNKGYTLHCLRHTCASELLNAGMGLECVQQLLGHSCIEITRRYARLTDKTREQEYFRAMKIIEKGEIDGHYQLDSELQAFSEKTKLLPSHDQELHEHP